MRKSALQEIGLAQAARFGLSTLALLPWRMMLVPQLRAPYLRLLGASIGKQVIIHDIAFFNAYRLGFAGLTIGDRCFVGDGSLLDLAERITLGDEVTLAERVTLLTHTNVGYSDHPLQRHFPAMQARIEIERGAFVGASSTILPGVRIGSCAFVAAGSLVKDDVLPRHLVGGVPARTIRVLDD